MPRSTTRACGGVRLGEELFEALEREPKRFPLKRRALAGRRGAPLKYDRTDIWRCVFELDEAARIVRVLALGPHDVAYEEAIARRTRFDDSEGPVPAVASTLTSRDAATSCRSDVWRRLD
jgi:hypothetical protein